VVATNSRLTKDEANKVAQMAHNGIATTVRPAHTMFDGDTIFAISLGSRDADVSIVGAYGAIAVEKAILSGTRAARAIEKIPSAFDFEEKS
jgi:L-aminopeptidase/D-esterase-like protein